jgi:hypothetical protein
MPSEHPVARSLAPWSTKAESYLLFTHLAKLPAEGVYHESEAAWAGDEFGAFKGGLGGVMIVRYSDTPVGKVFFFVFRHVASGVGEKSEWTVDM